MDEHLLITLREADSGGISEGEPSLDQQTEKVRAAWREKYRDPLSQNNSWVTEVYADHVIASIGEDHFSVPYSEDDKGEITFETEKAEKVERTWVTAEATQEQWLIGPVAEADGAEPTGESWDVAIITVGKSKNRRIYSEACLKKAAPIFEGVRVMARSDDEHLNGKQKSVEKIVGWIEGVSYANGAIRGRFHVSEAAQWLRTMLLDAWKRGKKDLVGLSIVASGKAKPTLIEGQQWLDVEEITAASSVDVVFDPAAGGGLVQLVAAQTGKEGSMDLKKLIEALAAAKVEAWRSLIEAFATIAGKEVDATVTEITEADADLGAKVSEAMKAPAVKPEPVKPAPKTKPITEAVTDDKPEPNEDLVPRSMAPIVIAEALGRTKLPDPVKTKLSERFTSRSFEITELNEAVKAEIDTFAELEKAGLVHSNGEVREASVTLEEAQKAKAALDGFFAREDVEVDGVKVKRYRSFKEAYIDLTGDVTVSGQLPRKATGKLGLSEANGGRVGIKLHEFEPDEDPVLSEAISTSGFTEIFGDSVRRQMVREYRDSDLATWQQLADVVPVPDFRTNRRIRWGGYANLAAVNQGAAYGAMSSPTDEEATYAATKRGGTETLNLEAIVNDDVGFIRRIPTRLARAAAQTLHEFVFDFLATNPTLYDTVALFHGTHANLGSAALDTASVTAARLRMRKQADMSNSKRIGLLLKHLFVPLELEAQAVLLTDVTAQGKPGTADNDINVVRKWGIDYTVVPYWTDVNNWFASADKADAPLVEVGFLYGTEEPEIFTQDLPNVGSMFTNDQVTLKIRHIYGGAVVDYRGLDGSVVA